MSEALLSVKRLKVSYGGIHAVKGIDFTVNAGEQVTLIGANGAGKTSSLRALTGLQPFEGDILFDGCSIRGAPPHRLLQRGLVMVPEGRGIFTRLTVRENLQLGAYARRDKSAVRQDFERVCATFPRLLILDEPSMGLAPIVVEAIFTVIKQLARDGVTLLLVEQNARLALESTDRAYVLDSGSLSHSGRSAEMLDDEKIKQIYLGE
ncbi:ABC transporter ATP-binding protein [Serratia marcescens]|uniref:ABC transporter ATP-binding protein n=1 Tax=Serratia marcescens TaxID=615 RepID=UPI002576FE2F|nr:ABC transporter ATP-binding protein [Serratia marcescens]WJH98581.1 ABC transporter ATP-binding protein [Serratia marcescens]BEO18465.1 ABC transporter ATP-binding protein [Serratia marcescens]